LQRHVDRSLLRAPAEAPHGSAGAAARRSGTAGGVRGRTRRRRSDPRLGRDPDLRRAHRLAPSGGRERLAGSQGASAGRGLPGSVSGGERSVIETMGLSKRYRDRVALTDLNLKIERGDVFGFIGPNGAGKST